MVWNGLARFRGLLGEWQRAEFGYQYVLGFATSLNDRRFAHRNLIQIRYLAGRLGEALESLEAAVQEPEIAEHMLYVLQAKVHLKLNQAAKAKAALERAGRPRFELEEWPWRLASAELTRQEGRLDEAVGLLDGLPLHTLHAREEARQFPQLFALLAAAGKPVPEPLPYVQGITVRVEARGVLRVAVNGRPVPVIPTGRVGELLVFLLERGGAASLEQIGDALYPGVTDAKRRRQAVWKLANGLREALGWEASIQALRSAYRLDPEARWQYDVAEARDSKSFEGEFLSGVYSEWALEVGRELQELEPPARRLDVN